MLKYEVFLPICCQWYEGVKNGDIRRLLVENSATCFLIVMPR